MTDQNLGLRVGAAGNQAAEVLSGSWRLLSDGTLTHEQLIEIHRELAEGFFANLQTLQAAQGIADAFPGTTAVPAQQAGFTPANQQPQQQAAPVVQGPWGQQQAAQPQGQNFQPTAQAPGTSHKDDAKWQALFANPSGYYDNRQDKANGRNPNGPDFKHKQSGDGLWLNGKYGPAPQWVFDRLQGGYGPVQ